MTTFQKFIAEWAAKIQRAKEPTEGKMTDIQIETINPNLYRLHIGSPEGTRWLGQNTTVQEWNGGLYFDVDRMMELLSDMHLEGVTVDEIECAA